jgi:hypothetical protein
LAPTRSPNLPAPLAWGLTADLASRTLAGFRGIA